MLITASTRISLYEFGNKIPREGTEIFMSSLYIAHNSFNLEIRYPERGRKLNVLFAMGILSKHLEIRYPERGRKLFMFRPPFKFTTLIWK